MESKPWGYFSVLWKGEGYLAKFVSVDPGKRLSLQFHRDRNEYWVIVEGSALVMLGVSDFNLNQGGTLVISRGVSHRIANIGERVEDDYGRV